MSDTATAHLIVVGADHKSSSMTLRDRLLLRESTMPGFYDRLRVAGFAEAMVLSTADRTEVIAIHFQSTVDAAAEIRKLLAAQVGLARNEVAAETYALDGRDAVKHVFAVACALDSLVVGDARVQESVRTAYDQAVRLGAVGARLGALMDRAFALVDALERETELTQRPSSIPAAAVHVARDLHGDLSRCRALLIGSGEMGELLAQTFVAAGLSHLVVTHPNPARGNACAQTLNCHAGDYGELPKLLEAADIVLTSMNTRHVTLERDAVRRAIAARRRKPIFLIDTGVPGDIDPSVASVEDAFVYTLDDLERVTRSGTRGYEKALARAWDMVGEAAAGFEGVRPSSTSDSDAIESLRRESLRLSGGDAEKATRLLVERLMRLKRDS